MGRDVLTAIAEASGSFSKGQRSIASYILNNYDKAAFLTANRLGAAVGVSESTVVRFAADLGFDGYPEMRRALQEMVKNRLTSVQRIEAARVTLDHGDIVFSVMNSDIARLRTTFEELDHAEFERAVDAIVHGKTIYIMGLRSASPLASFMGFYLNMIFPNVKIVSDNVVNDIFEQILRVQAGDVFVGISFPRYSQRTIRAMRYAHNRGAVVIGITDAETSLIAGLSDIRLYAKSEMYSFLDSLVSPLSLINALVVSCAQSAPGDLVQDFAELEKIWAEQNVYEQSDT